ncbi:hypothetical protein M434DRAFT_244049 [Hypoxylon sp. CO27-5]|nr:hypothetical protein M434DRAFT_244049 [Hypoxylon sp. CO27-5]
MLLTYQNIIAPLQLQSRTSKPSRRNARTHDVLVYLYLMHLWVYIVEGFNTPPLSTLRSSCSEGPRADVHPSIFLLANAF